MEGKPWLPAGTVLGRKNVVQIVREEAVQHKVDGHHDEDAADGDGAVRLPEVNVPLLYVQEEELVVGHGEGRGAEQGEEPEDVLRAPGQEHLE